MRRLISFGLCVLAVGCGGGVCAFEGKVYRVGATFTHGCDECTCMWDGVECDELACDTGDVDTDTDTDADDTDA